MFRRFVLLVFASALGTSCSTTKLSPAESVPQSNAANAGLLSDEAEAARIKRARLLKKKNILTKQYKSKIQNAVSQKFRPPAGASGTCQVVLSMQWPDKVTSVAVSECTNDGLEIRASIREAIRAVDPFPAAPHRAVFDSNIILVFNIP